MSVVVRQARLVLEMIKFEHTIFALPFALIGLMLATRAVPPAPLNALTVIWVLGAMVGARSAAMTFNRLADHDIDSRNPRTSMRHLPQGLISRRSAWLFFWTAVALFEISAAELNRLCFLLSPVALGIVLGYSYTKRFTSLCHLFLGLATGIAPIGAWIAVRGSLAVVPLLLGLTVLLWIGGFDIIYALQDYEHDCSAALFSLPRRLGKAPALLVSRGMHLLMVCILIAVGQLCGLHAVYYAGIGVVCGLLGYEHSLVKPNDLSRVNLAFFTLNGWISVTLFCFVLADCCLFR